MLLVAQNFNDIGLQVHLCLIYLNLQVTAYQPEHFMIPAHYIRLMRSYSVYSRHL